MVEMVIVLPFLMILLFAVIEFGIAFQRWQVVTNAAREGARAAAIRVQCGGRAEIEAVAHSYVAAAGIGDDVEIDVSDTCVPRGEPVTVTVRHDFRFSVLDGLLPSFEAGFPLTGTSVMRKE